MSDLRAMLGTLGLREPKTILQSGNFVFSAEAESDWEPAIEEALEHRLSVRTDVFVRSALTWSKLIAENPHYDMAQTDPSHLLAIVFKALPSQQELEQATDGYRGPETIILGSEALYAAFPAGIGASHLSAWPGWKKLNAHSTARNWNTVLKLGDLSR